MTRERRTNPDRTLSSGAEVQEVPSVSEGDQWTSEYRALQERNRRRTRLQHTTAIVSILGVALILALFASPALAVRFVIPAAALYVLIQIFLGLVEQWDRTDAQK
ncbi:MAG: hypothetical protein ACKO0Z_25160 [Betaproteobacteria bacterium]